MEVIVVKKKKRDYEVVETMNIPASYGYKYTNNCNIKIEKDESDIFHVYNDFDELIGTAYSAETLIKLLQDIVNDVFA